jgi:hypothetical protein
LIDQSACLRDIICSLKQFAKKEHYIFLRINPDDVEIETVLKLDTDFVRKDYFPFYKGSQNFDFNKYSLPEDQLLMSFQTMCRRKIKYADEIDFSYTPVQTQKELKEVYALFESLGKAKKFKYRSFKSYKEIFKWGQIHNLCSVYIAEHNGTIVCAAFIVKDARSFNYLSGALILKNIPPKNSPANKLHYIAMRDCFYKEHKSYYNISYSDPSSDVFIFKNSFRPVVKIKPAFYTYVINKKAAKPFTAFSSSNIKYVRGFLRNITRLARLARAQF